MSHEAIRYRNEIATVACLLVGCRGFRCAHTKADIDELLSATDAARAEIEGLRAEVERWKDCAFHHFHCVACAEDGCHTCQDCTRTALLTEEGTKP